MDILELFAALDSPTNQFGPYDPHTVAVVNELAMALWRAGDSEQCRMEQARVVYREVLDLCVRRSGDCHPSSLARKGDLALVLFSLGEVIEAGHVEERAIADARAPNRVLRYDVSGDSNAAQEIVRNESAWLPPERDSRLKPDQRKIHYMLANRLNWDTVTVC